MKECIEREAAVEIAMQYCPDDDGSCSKACVDLREMLDEIEAIPAADVVPVRHAIWRYKTMTVPGGRGQTYAKWSCTACKAKQKERSNYCPNCGAKMDGKDRKNG